MDEVKNININDSVTLTDSQVSQVYEALQKEDKSKDLLDAAKNETESTTYDSIEEQDIDIDPENPVMPPLEDIPTVLPRDVLKEALKQSELGIESDEDAETMIDLILEYRKNKNIKLFDRLPAKMKTLVEKFYRSMNPKHAIRSSKESIAKYFVDEIISAASFDKALKDIDIEMRDAYNTMEKEMAVIMDEAYNGIFDSIDEVRKEDPEKADKIQKVKDAFDRAKTFDYQLQFLHTQKHRDVRKYHIRFNDACSTFNKIVNTNLIALRIPKMEEIYEILKMWLPLVPKDDLKEFCTLICKSVENMDFSDIGDTAYVYKLIDSMYVFKHRHTSTYFEYEDFFKSIQDIISAINLYKNSNKEVK